MSLVAFQERSSFRSDSYATHTVPGTRRRFSCARSKPSVVEATSIAKCLGIAVNVLIARSSKTEIGLVRQWLRRFRENRPFPRARDAQTRRTRYCNVVVVVSHLTLTLYPISPSPSPRLSTFTNVAASQFVNKK